MLRKFENFMGNRIDEVAGFSSKTGLVRASLMLAYNLYGIFNADDFLISPDDNDFSRIIFFDERTGKNLFTIHIKGYNPRTRKGVFVVQDVRSKQITEPFNTKVAMVKYIINRLVELGMANRSDFPQKISFKGR